MRCAGAPAVPAGSPPGRRFSQVWWPPESRSTVDMPAGRVTELQGTEQQRREEKRVLGLCCGFLRQVVVFLSFFLLPAAFSNTPLTLSTPLSSGSRWDATSHCTLHSSVSRRVSFTHTFHLSAARAQLEDASSWTAESYRACVRVRRAKEMLLKEPSVLVVLLKVIHHAAV